MLPNASAGYAALDSIDVTGHAELADFWPDYDTLHLRRIANPQTRPSPRIHALRDTT